MPDNHVFDLPSPEPVMLPVKSLKPYPDYGRDRNPGRLSRLRRHWVPAGIGAFQVSRRANGDLIVFDGNHRLTIAKEKGDPLEVACLVHTGLSIPQEALLYNIVNNALPPKALDLFRAELAAGNKDAQALNRQVEEAGYSLGLKKSRNGARVINCIRALQGVQSLYSSNHVGLTLATLSRAFGNDPLAVRDHTVSAFAAILSAYPQLDTEHLIEVAGRHGYLVLKGMANSARYSATPPISQGLAYIRVLVQEYNRGLTGAARLETWGGRRAPSARTLRRKGQLREAVWNERIDEISQRAN